MSARLPQTGAEELDIATFIASLENATNSYKHVFFRALLRCCETTRDQ